MKQINILSVIAGFALFSCSGSSKRSGGDARAEFESRTGINLPTEAGDWEYASVRIGDTYGEYYRFTCAKDVFLSTTRKLALTADQMPAYAGSTHWGRAAGEGTPNDPSWWRPASASDQIFHKEDYSAVARRSVMALWYDEESETAFMKIDFWD